jgi:DNA-binding transcriptional LysR family regulator
VLEDWKPRSVGFYLYYPSRRQMPAALQAFIATLKAEMSGRRSNELPGQRAMPTRRSAT